MIQILLLVVILRRVFGLLRVRLLNLNRSRLKSLVRNWVALLIEILRNDLNYLLGVFYTLNLMVGCARRARHHVVLHEVRRRRRGSVESGLRTGIY